MISSAIWNKEARWVNFFKVNQWQVKIWIALVISVDDDSDADDADDDVDFERYTVTMTIYCSLWKNLQDLVLTCIYSKLHEKNHVITCTYR